MLDRPGLTVGRAPDHPEDGAGPGGTALSLSFPGDALSVRGALRALRGALRRKEIADEIAGVVEIVLAEVLNNVVEHAYAEDARGMIDLEIGWRGDALAFTIRDSGVPMPDGAAPAGRPHDLDVATDRLPEGGFGWHLIRELTSALEYRRRDGCNELSFLVPFAGRATRH